MNGDGSGKGFHLSLFFVVLRGDYDALQTWPFEKKVTMMLLDLGNGNHTIGAFFSESSSFQHLKSDVNIAFCLPMQPPPPMIYVFLCFLTMECIYRGYYTAGRRYEFYLQMVKTGY